MKKKVILEAVIVAVILVVIALAIILGGKSSGSVKLENANDVKVMLDTVYSTLDGKIPSLEIQEMDITDSMTVSAYTGLKSNDNVEMLVVSEPMMSSQAYSLVAVKVKNTANIETMKQEMLDNIDTNKWICVSASKVYVTNYNDVIFLVMASDEWAKPVYDEMKNYLNNNVGKELEKNAEEDIELPPEIIIE